MRFAARGSVRAIIAWLGTLGFLLYNAIMFVFATPFNRLFLAYIARLSLALWSIIALLHETDLEKMRIYFLPTMPVRAITAISGPS